MSELLVLTTVAGRCEAVFLFFTCFDRALRNILRQLKSRIDLKLKLAWPLRMCDIVQVFSRMKFMKKEDIKPLSRTLGHVIYLMRSLPLRFGTDPDSRRSSEYSVCPVRRARLCSNSTQHNVNFEETNTRQTSEPICSHLITTRKHS